jgi:hypothetical protein
MTKDDCVFNFIAHHIVGLIIGLIAYQPMSKQNADSIAVDGLFKGYKFNSYKKNMVSLQAYNGYSLDFRTYKLYAIQKDVKLFREIAKDVCPKCDKKAISKNNSHYCQECDYYF